MLIVSIVSHSVKSQTQNPLRRDSRGNRSRAKYIRQRKNMQTIKQFLGYENYQMQSSYIRVSGKGTTMWGMLLNYDSTSDATRKDYMCTHKGKYSAFCMFRLWHDRRRDKWKNWNSTKTSGRPICVPSVFSSSASFYICGSIIYIVGVFSLYRTLFGNILLRIILMALCPFLGILHQHDSLLC